MVILSPLNGTGVEIAAARLLGATSGTKAEVNGNPLELNANGLFQQDLVLRRGLNLLEVTAFSPSGKTETRQIVVFHVAPIAGLPFTLLYPPDGLVALVPSVQVIGVTKPDVVVGVNETPAEVNSLGIFSARIPLVEGSNLIEIAAVDIDGNVRFQTVGVFYQPLDTDG